MCKYSVRSNTNDQGFADLAFVYGASGDRPLAGDWNNDGRDTVGVFRASTGIFYLKNSNDPGFADLTFNFGTAGVPYQPIAGDWNSDGTDTIGLFFNGIFYLRNSNTTGFADLTFAFGNTTDLPLAGNWDGQPLMLPPTPTPSPTPNPGSPMNASFTYDGDGKRVKSTINGTTTYFIGSSWVEQFCIMTKSNSQSSLQG